LGSRLGDAAERAMIEMVDFNTLYSAKEKAGAEVKKTRRSRSAKPAAKKQEDSAPKGEASTSGEEPKTE
jgi:large subunit ribosomal protein L17